VGLSCFLADCDFFCGCLCWCAPKSDYSTETEFVELGKSGLDFKTVLAMLTTNPAGRMGVSESKGIVTAGKLADLTILDADPASDLTNFSRVHAVVRSGKLVWQR
jgi:imidazolonepropionase-like amidohydrolase